MARRVYPSHALHVALGMLTLAATSACGAPTPTPKPLPPTAPPLASATAIASQAPTPAPAEAPPAPAPQAPPEPAPSQAVLDAANRARSELTSLPSELRGEPKRDCSTDACVWSFDFRAPSKDEQGGLFGVLGVDEKSLATTFQTGDSDPLPIPVYVTLSKRAGAMVKAAALHPEVKRMCASSSRQGAPCSIYSDRMPSTAPCPANPAPTDACLWAVYVGSNMGSHVSRLATIYVEPVSAKVMGISDLVCPPISPDAFRARETRRAAKPPDDDHSCD